MAEEKVLVRDFYLYVNTGVSDLTPTWTQIHGLHPELEWSDSPTRADTTDQDDGGVQSHLVVSHEYKASVKGKRLEDPDDGSRDPGQAKAEEIANAIGSDSIGYFKIATPGGNAIDFHASATVKPFGGGMNDAATWECELAVSGEPDFDSSWS